MKNSPMKKSFLVMMFAITQAASQPVFACSDIFINRGHFHVQGRTMDYPINITHASMIGFIGQSNTTNVILEAEHIPKKQLLSWTNHYGYYGRTAFNSTTIIDGMNTQGLSVSLLFAPGTQYPAFNRMDKRPVLGIFDLGNYLLSQAANVQQAIEFTRAYQLVQSAIQAKEGVYITGIPTQLLLRDRNGDSALIHFGAGQVSILENIGNFFMNEPLNIPNNATLTAHYTSARMMFNALIEPTSTAMALYQATTTLDTTLIPTLSGLAATSWSVIKDLDNRVMYFKDMGAYQTGGSFVPTAITNSYNVVDLKTINFQLMPMEYMSHTIEPTPANQIKQLLTAK